MQTIKSMYIVLCNEQGHPNGRTTKRTGCQVTTCKSYICNINTTTDKTFIVFSYMYIYTFYLQEVG